jgi:hypothetical protein
MTVQDGDYIRPLPITAFYHDDTTQANITNTSYESGTPEVGVYFIAPASGTVRITIGGGVRDNNASNPDRIFLSPAVYADGPNGTQVLAPSVTLRGYGGSEVERDYQYGCRVSLLEGLEAGRQYYARVMFFTSDGTDPDSGDITSRDIIVIPMP